MRNRANPAATPEARTYALMKRLVKSYLRPYVGLLIQAAFFMLLAAAMTAMIAQLMQPVLDEVLNGHDETKVLPIAAAVLATFLVRGFATFIHTVLMNKIGQLIVGDVQTDLFNHFMKMDIAFFGANPSGQLISRVINDVNVMRGAATDAMTGLGKNFLTLLFLIGIMFYQDWKLAIAALTIFPFAAYCISLVGKKLRRISHSIQDETATLSGRLSQIFQGIRQVQAYGMEEHEIERSGKAIRRVRSLTMKSVRVSNLLTPLNEALIGFVLFGMIIYGGHEAVEGRMTAGQLGSFLAAFTLAYEPMKKTARLNTVVQMGLGATERVFHMLDMRPAIQDKADAKTLAVSNPDIAFIDVVFEYAEPKGRALDGVSFTARAGEVTALVGPSGGGKTTIVNLIPRFYEPLSGHVAVGGLDTRDVMVESLRRHIALVSQDITIFDESIAANIAYGAHGAAQEDIENAARAAAAHDFIMQMPQGYETKVGEDGTKLSGGQRQRIAIARAILRNAPILLLDEATSALDNESEKLVQEALERLEKGRTTIVIAHRMSTVQNAHQIIVLDKGRIVEQGRHEDLLAKGGLYKKMLDAGLRG